MSMFRILPGLTLLLLCSAGAAVAIPPPTSIIQLRMRHGENQKMIPPVRGGLIPSTPGELSQSQGILLPSDPRDVDRLLENSPQLSPPPMPPKED